MCVFSSFVAKCCTHVYRKMNDRGKQVGKEQRFTKYGAYVLRKWPLFDLFFDQPKDEIVKKVERQKVDQQRVENL